MKDAVVAFAREILTAARTDPGRVPASLLASLDRAGVDAGQREELIEAVREAQVVHSRQRHRAAELEALYSTARELVRVQDVDDVLRRLVDRAHDLMGTDVTYLSEYDAGTEDMRVQFSAGTVTPEFRDLRIPAGYGLTSLVAGKREPAWVASYASMADVPRHGDIERAVSAEGLVSFLGVPLIAGDEVLGALFACNRFAHEYSPDEVLLLQAFADHAAAVLQSARVLAESEAATAKAEDAYRQLERNLAATEMASAVHEELTAAVVSGGTVLDVVSTLSRRLERDVWAVDPKGKALNVSEDGADDLPAPETLRPAIVESHGSGHVAAVADDSRTWLVSAILGADRVEGAIVTEERDGLDDVARRTLERAAHIAALVSFKQEAVSAIRDEHKSRWLLATLEGRTDVDARIVPPEDLTAVAVVEIGAARATSAAGIAARTVGESGFVAHRDRRVIIAWTDENPLERTERVRRVMSDALHEPGIAAVVLVRRMVPGQLPDAVERATRDAQFLPALGAQPSTVSSDAFAPYHALAPKDAATTDGFIEDLLGPVLAWDAKRRTELFDTLAAYFEGGESRPATAAALHIHTNTVQQRLERVQSLLPGDVADAEFRFRLQAAVRLERLRRAIRAAASR